MRDKLSALVTNQIPEHLASNQNLVAFISAYYEYLEQRKQGAGLVNYSLDNRDIDLTLSEFVENFYESYAPLLPKNTSYNRRDLIKKIHDLYESKGSKKSVALLFRLLYNADITMLFPQEQMLIASGSKWVQESAFRVTLKTGDTSFVTSARVLTWTNSSGIFTITPTSFRLLSGNLYEVRFNQRYSTQFLGNEIIKCLDTNGALTNTFEIEPTPGNIRVVSKGKNFKAGQIFKLKGTYSDSIIRVTDVGPNGELVRLQFLDYGYQLPIVQSLEVSPYSSAPISDSNEFNQSGNTTTGTLSSNVNGISDSGSIILVPGEGSPNLYFAEDYLQTVGYQPSFGISDGNGNEIIDGQTGSSLVSLGDPPYFGLELYSFSSGSTGLDNNTSASEIPPSITREEYLASIATLEISSKYIAVYPGTYVSNQGNISDFDIKLQDSYYYQIFSYVIQSPVSITTFKKALTDLAHPAGEIFFSNLQLDYTADFKSTITAQTFNILRLDLEDSAGVSDSIAKRIAPLKNDSVGLSDDNAKSFTRGTEYENLPVYDDNSKSITLPESDSVSALVDNPETTKSILPAIDEVVVSLDDDAKTITPELIQESILADDYIAKSVSQTYADGVSAIVDTPETTKTVTSATYEIISASDTLASTNTYVDPTYFATNDYVLTPSTEAVYKSITPASKNDLATADDVDTTPQSIVTDGNGNTVTDGNGNVLVSAENNFSTTLS